MDAFVMVDWSAASERGPVGGKADGLWAAVAEPGTPDRVQPFRTRADLREWLVDELVRLVGQGHRVLCGLDFCFGYPAGTASALGMPSGATAWRWMWERVARAVRDDDNGRNDRFAAAARLNLAMEREDGPFWGNGLPGDITGLPRTKGQYPMEVANGIRLEEHRTVERHLKAEGQQPSSVWQLSGAGSVGGQTLVGLPTLWRLRHHPALKDRCRIWPFEVQSPSDEPGVTIAEVYPSLLADDPDLHEVRDARQVLALVDGYRQMAADGTLAGALVLPDLDAAARTAVTQEEGWILPVARDASRPRSPVRRARPTPFIPRGLVEDIAAGRCVAIVGPGFAAAEMPTWPDLLADLAADPAVPDPVRRQVTALVTPDRRSDRRTGRPDGQPTEEALDAAARLIAAALPDGQLRRLLQTRLETAATGRSARRRDLLTGIPFASILTTTIGAGLPGLLPGPTAYRQLLRSAPAPWWHQRHWHIDDDADEGTAFSAQSPAVVNLHGDAAIEGSDDQLVFTAEDQRRRAFGPGGYGTVLRSLLSTHTALYLGVSLRDPSLSQIRAEVLELVGHDAQRDAPLGYAVLPDVASELHDFHRAHEGIEVIGYETGPDQSSAGDASSRGTGRDRDPDTAAEAFDDVLEALHGKAGHDALLRRAVEGRTILWVDPAQSRNAPGIAAFTDVAGDSLLLVGGIAEARGVLRSRPVDLVITHWGHREGGRPVGEEVLAAVRASRNPCPTLVFAWGDYADVNRPRAMALGATDYVWTWPGLFREVARVLAPAPRHPWDLAPRLDDRA